MRTIGLLVRRDLLTVVEEMHVWLLLIPVLWMWILPSNPEILLSGIWLALHFFVFVRFRYERDPGTGPVLGILPVTRRQTILARYAYCYLLMGIFAAYVLLACPSWSRVTGSETFWARHLLLGVSLGCAVMSVYIPLLSRRKPTKVAPLLNGMFGVYLAYLLTANYRNRLGLWWSRYPLTPRRATAILVIGCAALPLASMAVSLAAHKPAVQE